MISDKLKKIKLLLCDVDGVLTDGGIIYSDQGQEIKVFNSKDGLGIRLLMTSGIKVGIVTGRKSKALAHRCKNLGINYIFDGISDKASVIETIINKTGFIEDEIAFIGDDLPDLPIMKRVGAAIAVADAHEAVINNAIIVTNKNGGNGAVREVCDNILKAKGLWDKILNQFI